MNDMLFFHEGIVDEIVRSREVKHLIVGAPCSGKSMILSALAKRLGAGPQFIDSEGSLVRGQRSSAEEIAARISTLHGHGDEALFLLIDDLDQCFSDRIENCLRALPDTTPGGGRVRYKLVATSRTPITKSSTATFGWGDQSAREYAFFSSLAFSAFSVRYIKADFGDYREALQRFIEWPNEEGRSDSRTGASSASIGNDVATKFLEFAGPIPHITQKIIRSMFSEDPSPSWDAVKVRLQTYEPDPLELSVLQGSLEWISRMMSTSQIAKLIDQAAGEDADFAVPEESLVAFRSATMLWRGGDGHLAPLIRAMMRFLPRDAFFQGSKRSGAAQEGASAHPAKEPPRGGLLTVKLRANTQDALTGQIVVLSPEGDTVSAVTLAPIEWDIAKCLKQDELNDVSEVTSRLGTKDERSIRAAIHRIVEKLEAREMGWVMRNIPRKGYFFALNSEQ